MSKWGNRFKKWFFSEIEATLHLDQPTLHPNQTFNGHIEVHNPTTKVVHLSELRLTLITSFQDITLEGNEFRREVDIQEMLLPLEQSVEPAEKTTIPFSFTLSKWAPSSNGAPYSIEATLWDNRDHRVWFDVLEHVDVALLPELKHLIDSTEKAGLEWVFTRNVISPLGDTQPFSFIEKYGFRPKDDLSDHFEVVKAFWRFNDDKVTLYYWLDNIEKQRTLDSLATDVEIRKRTLDWEQVTREPERIAEVIRETLQSHTSP